MNVTMPLTMSTGSVHSAAEYVDNSVNAQETNTYILSQICKQDGTYSIYVQGLIEASDISSVFISNKTVSVAGNLRWSTTPGNHYTGGVAKSSTSFFVSYFLQPG